MGVRLGEARHDGYRTLRSASGRDGLPRVLRTGRPRASRVTDELDRACAAVADLYDAGRIQECVPLLQTTLRRHPDSWRAHYLMGLVRGRQGRSDDAIAAYRMAVALRPTLWEAHNNLGLELCHRQMWAEAVAALREALRHNPGAAVVHANLGRALGGGLGRTAEAKACYLEALRLDPALPEAHQNLASLLIDEGDLSSALEHYRQAVQTDPTSVGARSGAALVLAKLGELDSSIAEYRTALALEPVHGPSLVGLGTCLFLRALEESVPHALTEARDLLERARRADPRNREVCRTLRELEGILRRRRRWCLPRRGVRP